MIRKHNRCRGIRIWKWNRLQIELWFAPKNEEIEPHTHQQIDSTIVFLAGQMFGRIAGRGGLLEWPVDSFRKFHVPTGVVHSAKIGTFAIFANVERWIGPPTSASEDFSAA